MALYAVPDPPADPRRARIWALFQALKQRGHAPEVSGVDPASLSVPANRAPVTVRCDPRGSCGGELWFYFPGGYPIAPADDLHMDAAVKAIQAKIDQRL